MPEIPINPNPTMQFSNAIRTAFYTHSFESFQVAGPQGLGKTRFSLHVAWDLYNHDWEFVKKIFFFEKNMQDFVNKFNALIDLYERVPLVILDDFGTWAIKYEWGKREAKQWYKQFNLIRNQANGLILTVIESEDILKFVRGKCKYNVILKPEFDTRNIAIDPVDKWVMAIAYEKHRNPDESWWIEDAMSDRFNFWIPDDIQAWETAHRMEVIKFLKDEDLMANEKQRQAILRKQQKKVDKAKVDKEMDALLAQIQSG